MFLYCSQTFLNDITYTTVTVAAETAKSYTADNIFDQKSGPASAGPARPATTALAYSIPIEPASVRCLLASTIFKDLL